MTKKNYTLFSNQQLIDESHLYKTSNANLNRFIRNRNPELYSEIVRRTTFLDSELQGNISIITRIYCLENGIISVPKCHSPKCTNKVKWYYTKFTRHCSPKCTNDDQEVREKTRNICNERYGGIGFASKELSDKVKQTNLERLGVEFASQSEKWRDKVRETSQRKWHVDNPFQSEEVKEKTRNTIMQKHGVDHISKVKSIMEKRDQTLNERYGGVGYASSSIREKCEQTCENRFGVRNYTQSNEYKEQYDEIQSKRTQTCEIKYGVSHYAKTKEFARAIHKPYTNPKYHDMTFSTSWEFKVYDFLMEHNIEFEYQPSISIPYECEGTHHTYHPDFKVCDKIVEVKGDQFFRMNESTGREEMFCPWRGDLSDKEYEFKCKIEEAKHQCMIANDVIILRGKDIDNLMIEMFI